MWTLSARNVQLFKGEAGGGGGGSMYAVNEVDPERDRDAVMEAQPANPRFEEILTPIRATVLSSRVGVGVRGGGKRDSEMRETRLKHTPDGRSAR